MLKSRHSFLSRLFLGLWFVVAPVVSYAAFPYATSTGTFDGAASVNENDWDDFKWYWDTRSDRKISVVFTNVTGGTNIWFRMAYPERGYSYLTVENGTFADNGSQITWTTPVAIPVSNIPPPKTYYAEFLLVDSDGTPTLSLSKGRVETEWSIYQITNAASWTPVSVSYVTTGTITVAESDPYFHSWVGTNTYVHTESDPVHTNWLATNTYLQSQDDEVDPGFTNWVGTNTYLQDQDDETDPVFTNWVGTNTYLQDQDDEADPVFTNWLGTNTFLQSESDPVHTNWLTTNTYLQSQDDEVDPGFTNWLGTNTYLQDQDDEVEPAFTNWLGTNTAVAQAETAYGWGDHAEAGYLSSGTNIFTEAFVANQSVLGADISGLSDHKYTGDVNSVIFTGVTAVSYGKTYAWGFSKLNSFGTSVLSIGTAELRATSSGNISNLFSVSFTNQDLILSLYGDGSSKSDVTNVYVREITNGVLGVALDAFVGRNLYVNGSEVNEQIGAAETNNTLTSNRFTVAVGVLTTNLDLTSNHFAVVEGVVDTNILNIESISNDLDLVEGLAATNEITILAIGEGSTNFANTLSLAVGLGASNLSYEIGLGASNYVDIVGAAVGLGASNLSYEIGLGASNYVDIVGVAVGLGSSNLSYEIGLGASNYVDIVGAAVGLGATNLSFEIGLGASNYVDIVGAAVGLGATNIALAIGAGATASVAEATTLNAVDLANATNLPASGVIALLTPTNYTTAGTNVENHLAGIDVALASVGSDPYNLTNNVQANTNSILGVYRVGFTNVSTAIQYYMGQTSQYARLCISTNANLDNPRFYIRSDGQVGIGSLDCIDDNIEIQQQLHANSHIVGESNLVLAGSVVISSYESPSGAVHITGTTANDNGIYQAYNETNGWRTYIHPSLGFSIQNNLSGSPFDVLWFFRNGAELTNIYAKGEVSAAGFTDRTPFRESESDAISALQTMKPKVGGGVDYDKLDESLKSSDNGRNLSQTVSDLVQALQWSRRVITNLQERIEALEAEKEP